MLFLCAAPLWARPAEPQPQSDRLVGWWRSSTGAELRLAYSGQASHFLIEIQQPRRPGYLDAFWLSELTFFYIIDGDRIEGRYEPATDTIQVHNVSGSWSATWRRK